MKTIMSVDVEEWFHIPEGDDNILTFDHWDKAPERVQHVLPGILDIFEKNQVNATFFFLGWIAEKYPFLVKETLKRGHEIASHGYAHKLIYTQKPGLFKEDINKSKVILGNITGKDIIGYRAPGFSITPETEWAFDILSECGIKHDSSIFPGQRFYGHFRKFGKEPAIIRTSFDEIIEFPQSVVDFGLFRFSCFGGGYFRLTPEFVFRLMARIIDKSGRPLIIYIHPRDMDVDQPRIKFSYLKSLRHYINISKTLHKLDEITRFFNFISFEKAISDVSFISKLEKLTFCPNPVPVF
jgi:polysaccharide deacetylase family protein (PEP-CTERM system associated)